MLTPEQVSSFMDHCERRLLASDSRQPMRFNIPFPPQAGVYAFFLGDKLAYIGESTSLRQRLNAHLRNPENHVLILKIARCLHVDTDGAIADTAKRKKFPEATKAIARTWIENNFSVAFLAIPIGRKELEEILIKKHSPPFNERDPTLE